MKLSSLLLLAAAAVPQILSGGAVLTKDGKADLGKVTREGDALIVEVQYGKVRYAATKVVWYTDHPRVDTLYKAAIVAEKKGDNQAAMALYKLSARDEPDTRDKAEARLTAVKKIVYGDNVNIAHAAAPTTPKEPKPAKKRKQSQANATTALIGDQLVAVAKKSLAEYDSSEVNGKKIYAVYFSAHWCGPCRAFTPKLVAAYKDLQRRYADRFELIFVSRDRSPEEMVTYMTEADMPWPAVAYDQTRSTQLNQFAGRGIPCLVIMDDDAKILSDSRQKSYLEVLDDFSQLVAGR